MAGNDLLDYLKGFITERRYERIHQVVQNRTRYITLVLEDIFQTHNASAVLRTCDCLGIQDVHAIENRNSLQVNPEIALGASKWLSLHHYNSCEVDNGRLALQKLRQAGYRIVATTPHDKGVSLENFDLATGKTALLFGTELTGLSTSLIGEADEFLMVPMVGFTESFNISVTAAIILYQLTYRLRHSEINWQLTQDEKLAVEIDWVRGSIRDGDRLEQEYIAKNGKPFW
jgi:tRNA (guanosine-2'-O-)-methyltransferase